MIRLRKIIPMIAAVAVILTVAIPAFAQDGVTDIVFEEGATEATVTVEDASTPQQFRVRALAGQNLTVVGTPAQEGTTLEMTLQQEEGDFTTVETAEDTIAVQLPADGAYILTVVAANDAATPGFTATITIPPLDDGGGEGEEGGDDGGEGEEGGDDGGDGEEGGEEATGDDCIITVEPGQTLYRIALNNGITVDELRSLNPDVEGDLIYAGQTLNIPCESAGSDVPAQGTTYTVQPGDNLFRIALRFGVTVDAIRAANDISGDLIYAGDTLVIPGDGMADDGGEGEEGGEGDEGGEEGDADPETYTVQTGDTLYSIAAANGTTVATLVELNGIVNPDRIDIGQVLILP